MFTLLRERKNILSIISILMLVNKRGSSRNQTISRLFYRKKPAKTMP